MSSVAVMLRIRRLYRISPQPTTRTPVGRLRRKLKGGKGNRARRVLSRRIPLHEAVVEVLREYFSEVYGAGDPVPDDFLFRNLRFPGKPLGRIQAYFIVKNSAAVAGLDGAVTPHSLRRTFATDVYRGTNFDLVATQRIVGHSSPLVTANYLRTDQDELDAVVRNLGVRVPATFRENFSIELSPNSASTSASISAQIPERNLSEVAA